MNIVEWWPKLDPSAQEWLVANNGDVVAPHVLEKIAVIAGPPTLEASWVGGIDRNGIVLSDEATDWIEAVANEEAEVDAEAETPYGHG